MRRCLAAGSVAPFQDPPLLRGPRSARATPRDAAAFLTMRGTTPPAPCGPFAEPHPLPPPSVPSPHPLTFPKTVQGTECAKDKFWAAERPKKSVHGSPPSPPSRPPGGEAESGNPVEAHVKAAEGGGGGTQPRVWPGGFSPLQSPKCHPTRRPTRRPTH